jgi:hypothetical protein
VVLLGLICVWQSQKFATYYFYDLADNLTHKKDARLNTTYYFFDKLNHAGHFWDRLAALFALSASNAQFLGYEFASNVTRFVIPYYDFFPDPLTNFFSGVNQLDHSTLGPRVTFDSSGAATMKMINSTSMTSTSGTTLISASELATRRPRRPAPAPLDWTFGIL